MKPYLIQLFFFLAFSCRAQLSFDSLPAVSGLSNLLISGPFICPDEKQPIKFPKQFYKESKTEQILKIERGSIVKEVSCISEKRPLSYYLESKHYCEWIWGLNYLSQQCNKWKKAGSSGVLPSIKKQFYEKLMASDMPCEFFVPDLTLNYFYLNKDSFPDLIVYDGSDGTDPRTVFIEYRKDSLIFLHSISGYAYDVRKNANQILVLTKQEKSATSECHCVYNLKFDGKEIKVVDSVFLYSGKGMSLPSSYSMDKKFRTRDSVNVGKFEQNKDEGKEIFPPNSFGYVLGESKGLYFVAMLNNLPAKSNEFRKFVEMHYTNKFKRFYTLGWVDKEMARFN